MFSHGFHQGLKVFFRNSLKAEFCVVAFTWLLPWFSQGAPASGGPPLGRTPAWVGIGENQGDDYGFKVTSAGDIYGDGYDCVLVSAPGSNQNAGKVYLYRGGPEGLSKEPVWVAVGEKPGDGFGTSMGAAGDLNGDGYADIYIDAPTHSAKYEHEGKLYVYYGGPRGLPAAPSWTITGEQNWEDFGDCTTTIGDINGDGYCDLIVGAYNYHHGRGKVRVYLGSAQGLSDSPAWTMEGEADGDNLGYSHGSAGDVNGDGYGDFLVGAKFNDHNRGKAYLFLGSGKGIVGQPVWTMTGDNPSDTFANRLYSAGDVNGDGYGDIIVGAPGYGMGGGAAYVYEGGPKGLSERPSWFVRGNRTDHAFGYSVNCAGDVNNDGYSDVIVGAPGSLSLPGRAALYLGSAKGLSIQPAWQMSGEGPNDEYGKWVASAGDVNGDGYAAVIVGEGGFDSIRGKAFLYLGNGGRKGPAVCPRQSRTDGRHLIGPMGMAGPGLGVRLLAKAESPEGPSRVKLQAELKPAGVPFDGTGLVEDENWVVVGRGAQDITLTCWRLKPDTGYRWRLRVVYQSPRFNHGKKYSPWFKPSYGALGGGCYFRTPHR